MNDRTNRRQQANVDTLTTTVTYRRMWPTPTLPIVPPAPKSLLMNIMRHKLAIDAHPPIHYDVLWRKKYRTHIIQRPEWKSFSPNHFQCLNETTFFGVRLSVCLWHVQSMRIQKNRRKFLLFILLVSSVFTPWNWKPGSQPVIKAKKRLFQLKNINAT